MTELLTVAQMRAIEKAAIDAGDVTGLALMERAGQGVVEAILAAWPAAEGGQPRAVILCGPGNNGGDGFVVARLLKARGWTVELFLHGEAENLPPDARVNCQRWAAMGDTRALAAFDPADATRRSGQQRPVTLIVDALFGTGLTRPIDGRLAGMMAELSQVRPGERPVIVAVDVPSGLCADSGRILGAAMPADLVVTFHRPKIGHYLAEGAGAGAPLMVKDIGLEARAPQPSDIVHLVSADPARFGRDLDKGRRCDGGMAPHKYAHGHALIVSGDHGRAGAARLAARGALRIGAGLVTVASPPGAMAENAARLDAIMLREMAEAAGLRQVLEDPRINALCLGPGMGTDTAQADLVAATLASGRRTVLDADALTLLSRHPALWSGLHGGCTLTPHAGEFARLFPDIAEKLAAPATSGPAYSKVDATRAAAARAGCVVLFKGPDTVIADPSGRAALSAALRDRAAPWLATAGSGDVLAGFITGLLARGFDPFAAACTGAWLHVSCARAFGPGLIAEDLPETLPRVLADLLAG